MKLLLSILFLVLIFITAKAQDMDLSKTPDFPEWRNNSQSVISSNKIKTEMIYAFSSSKKNIDSAKAEEITYDSLGNITSKKIFPSNFTWLDSSSFRNINTDTMITRYVYEPNKKLQKIIDVSGITGFVYNNLGNKKLQYECNKDTTQLTLIKFVYDGKNKLIETSRQFIHDNKNVFIEKYQQLNDNAFELSKKYYYYDNGKINKIEEYVPAPYRIKMNSNGNQTAGTHKNLVSSTYTYKLNSKNNYKVAYWNHSLFGQTLRDKYIFDDSNRIIKFIMTSLQPVRYINQDNNSLYKNEYKQTTRENNYSYNNNGTLSIWKLRVNGQIVEFRKHYYTYY